MLPPLAPEVYVQDMQSPRQPLYKNHSQGTTVKLPADGMGHHEHYSSGFGHQSRFAYAAGTVAFLECDLARDLRHTG